MKTRLLTRIHRIILQLSLVVFMFIHFGFWLVIHMLGMFFLILLTEIEYKPFDRLNPWYKKWDSFDEPTDYFQ